MKIPINQLKQKEVIELTNGITLRPDQNRNILESESYKRLQAGDFFDSISYEHSNGERKRILLIVPQYTKIRKSLELIEDNLRKYENSKSDLRKDLRFINRLKLLGVTYIEEMQRAGIPIGLLRVGTVLKERYNVKIIDGTYEGWDNAQKSFIAEDGSEIWTYGISDAEIRQRINSFNPDIVGITCAYTHQWGNARNLADIIKSMNPNVPIIMGGVHAHALPEDVLRDSPTDYCVYGQADDTIVELVDRVLGITKQDIEDIKGVVLRKNGKVLKTGSRKFKGKTLFQEVAIPDFSLIDDLSIYSGEYHSAGKRKRNHGNIATVFTSIGCNTGCTFCTIPGAQGPFVGANNQTLDNLLLDLKTKHDVSEILIEDDNFVHDPYHALMACDILNRYDMVWFEEGGIALYALNALLPEVREEDIIREEYDKSRKFTLQMQYHKIFQAKRDGITTEDLIKKMADSGCYGVYLAVESVNEDSLKTSNKPTINSIEEYTLKTIGLFSKYGVSVTCGLMLGFVNPENEGIYIESREAIERNIKWGKKLKKAGADYINPFIFTPLPGAPHYPSLKDFSTRNTDIGYSHEFPTLNKSPDGKISMDEYLMLREQVLLECNGEEAYMKLRNIKTWPVG